MITENFMVMKPLHKKLKKALVLYDEIVKKVTDYETDLERSIYEKLDTIIHRLKKPRLDQKII